MSEESPSTKQRHSQMRAQETEGNCSETIRPFNGDEAYTSDGVLVEMTREAFREKREITSRAE